MGAWSKAEVAAKRNREALLLHALEGKGVEAKRLHKRGVGACAGEIPPSAARRYERPWEPPLTDASTPGGGVHGVDGDGERGRRRREGLGVREEGREW